MEDEIPAADDNRWQRWSFVVSEQLTYSARSSKELAQLIPTFSQPLIVNVLCWMDMHELVEKDASKRPVLWRMRERKPPPPKPPPACPVCAGAWTVTLVGVTCVNCGRPQ